MPDDLQAETPPEAAPTDCNGQPHVYAHEHGPHSPVSVGRCMACGVIDWADLRNEVAQKVAEALAERDEELEGLRLIVRVNHGLHRSAHEDAVSAEAALVQLTEECAALRTQLTAARMALKGAEREAEAVGRRCGSLAKELRTAQATIGRVQEVASQEPVLARFMALDRPSDYELGWASAMAEVERAPIPVDGAAAASEEQTGSSNA